MDEHNKTGHPILDPDPHRVYFYPPLHEQRRAWILDVLRGERPRISSILDIGCGEGTLLGVLCQPVECHPTPDDFDARFRIPGGGEIRLRSVIDTVESMYPRKIAGLDVSSAVLQTAKGLLESQANGYPFLPPKPRWQELKVQLWNGGLEEYNLAFEGYDCIVATEVIEHLHDDALLKFCPMILGRYTPRIFLMTTPCYDFNQLFTPPEDLPSQNPPADPSSHTPSPPLVREGGFLDPTGRTTRVFRHNDHKFEWTRDEFKSWCLSQADQWGYDVKYGGIGRSTDPDPWGRDVTPSGDPLRATFTAIFRRRADRHPSPPATLVDSDAPHHQLILDTAHPAHPSSNKALPLDHIRDAVQECILGRRDGNAIEVCDLWGDDALALACGGSLETLFASVDALVREAGDWEWDGAGRSRWRRRIVWNGYTGAEGELPMWQEMAPVDEDASQEEDGISLEDSPNQESPTLLDWGTGVGDTKSDFGWRGLVGSPKANHGGDDWNRDIDGWGSPPSICTELDDWGDWDEKQGEEIKHDNAGGW